MTSTLQRPPVSYERLSRPRRFTLTEFARGREWQQALREDGMVEVSLKGAESAVVLDSSACDQIARDHQELEDRVAELEAQVESLELAQLLRERLETRNPLSGDALAEAALGLLDEGL